MDAFNIDKQESVGRCFPILFFQNNRATRLYHIVFFSSAEPFIEKRKIPPKNENMKTRQQWTQDEGFLPNKYFRSLN